MSQWLRGNFGKTARDVILGSRLFDQGYFKRAEIERMIEAHRSNKEDNSQYIWTLFNVASWYDYWIDRR